MASTPGPTGVLSLERFDPRARAALVAAQARADASGHRDVTVLHLLRALLGAETPARAFEARGGDVARALAAADAELATSAKAESGAVAYLSAPLAKILERLGAEPDTVSYERLLDECLAFGATPTPGEAERVHRVRGASGLAAVAPTQAAAPAPSTTTLTLDTFTAGARRAVAGAQRLADARGHRNMTLVHLLRVLLDAPVVQTHVRSRRGDPARAIEAADVELAAEARGTTREPSFLSAEAHRLLRGCLEAGRETSLVDLLHCCVESAAAPEPTPLKRIVDAGALAACTSKLAHPAPRAFATRSAERGNARDALDALAELGNIAGEPPLLVARIRANALLDDVAAADADFITLTGQPNATIEELRQAHRALAGKPSPPDAPTRDARLLGALLDRMPPHPTGGASPLHPYVHAIPLAEWPLEALVRLLEDGLIEPPAAGSDLGPLDPVLAAIRARAPDDARTGTLARRLAEAKAALEARRAEARRARAACRPDFDELEGAFHAKLPRALRRAWEAHFEGETVGFGFYEPPAGAAQPLVELARSFGAPRVFPFAVGEHEGDYFALDLGRPARSGAGDVDYPVVLFATGERWTAYPSSAEWLAADGAPRYD